MLLQAQHQELVELREAVAASAIYGRRKEEELAVLRQRLEIEESREEFRDEVAVEELRQHACQLEQIFQEAEKKNDERLRLRVEVQRLQEQKGQIEAENASLRKDSAEFRRQAEVADAHLRQRVARMEAEISARPFRCVVLRSEHGWGDSSNPGGSTRRVWTSASTECWMSATS